jgi:simple sugar transport system ATP-binding protein
LEELKSRGTGILLISEDIHELLLLSDRIAVMYDGGIAGVLNGAEANMERIGWMMTGQE